MNTAFDAMNECAAEAARLARGVRPEQLSGPTPCTEYDVRALVNHWVLFTSHGLERRARREPLPEDLLDRDFTADPDWANAYAEQLDRALDAWRSPGVWEGDIDLGGGASASASDVAALVTKEMVVHGWDVAVATGQDLDVSEATGAFVLDVVERHGALYREYKGFAEPVSAPPGASAFTRALAHSGRAPDWTP